MKLQTKYEQWFLKNQYKRVGKFKKIKIMANYELNIAFTNEQLQTIYATGTNVIVAKPSGGGTPNVAWQYLNL
ncbi:MAG: hypothetical protein HRT57_10230 [Crocinitomicaceae bacterium]|nr:hypothetical protein [Crocinitomicaceae bacterium]